jgi:hypothetical protein
MDFTARLSLKARGMERASRVPLQATQLAKTHALSGDWRQPGKITADFSGNNPNNPPKTVVHLPFDRYEW